MAYIDDLLATNEHVIYTARKHWIAPLFATLTGTLLTLGALGALGWSLFVDGGWFDQVLVWGGWIALAVGVVMLVRGFVIWASQRYLVTNHKVMKVRACCASRQPAPRWRRSTTPRSSSRCWAACSTTGPCRC